MELADLEVFGHTAQLLSFTQAAKRLGVPKSAVSRAITRLEQQLNVRLFQRTTRSMRLTEAGELLATRSVDILQQVNDVKASIDNLQNNIAGHLRVTMPVDLGLHFMGQLVAEFMQVYPEVSIDVELSEKVVDIVGEGVDVAFRLGKLKDSTLIAKQVGELRMGFFASPDYLRKKGTPLSPSDLIHHNFILFKYLKDNALKLQPISTSAISPKARQSSPNWVTQKINGRLTVNQLSIALEAAVAGVGICLIPSYLANKAVVEGQLIRALSGYHVQSVGLYMVYPSRTHPPSVLTAFLDFMHQRINLHPLLA